MIGLMLTIGALPVVGAMAIIYLLIVCIFKLW